MNHLSSVQSVLKNMPAGVFQNFMRRLEQVFAEMDGAYRQAAAAYGFQCHGCDDNCCASKFYHYTVLEYLYIRNGFETLSHDQQQMVTKRAAAAVDGPSRRMCPLNDASRCILYPYRPMICRLHGIPHTFTTPSHTVVTAPGCDDFTRRCGQQQAERLDRTPFYRKLSGLEMELRTTFNIHCKIKLTIADMLADAKGNRI